MGEFKLFLLLLFAAIFDDVSKRLEREKVIGNFI